MNGSTVYWGGGPTSVDHDVIKSAELRFGALSPLGYGLTLTSYVVGVSVRQWKRSLQGTGGYHEVYANDYVGGGLLFQDAVDSRLVLPLDSFFGSTFNAHMNASGIPGGAHPFTPESYQFGKRFMYQISGTVDYALTKHLHLRFGAEYNRFRFGEPPPFFRPILRTGQHIFGRDCRCWPRLRTLTCPPICEAIRGLVS